MVIFIIIYVFFTSVFYEDVNEKNFFNQKIEGATSFNMVLEIPKINLKKGLYDINSDLNNVEKGIEINNSSDYPDVINGNLILESHSGTSFVSYFKNLEKLKENDEVFVYYDNIKYVYLIDNYYYIKKTGKAAIKRNLNKNSVTLITCVKNENKQVVYVGYLYKKTNY